jgi:hypothetical protein
VCWSDFGPSATLPASNIGFTQSGDGGITYTGGSSNTSNSFSAGTNSYQFVTFGTTYNALGANGSDPDPTFGNTRVNGFPSMAVDKSCFPSPRRGRIYIVTAELVPGNPVKSVINMRFSDNKGATWSGPIQVSDPSLSFCWFPWIAVDDVTGVASVVYYGYNGSYNNTFTFLSFSDPNDPTNWGFLSSPMSSVARTPNALESPPWGSGYEGDYIGIAAFRGEAFAVWTDSRNGGPRNIFIARVDYNAQQLESSSQNLDFTSMGTTIIPTPSTTTNPPTSNIIEAFNEILVAGGAGEQVLIQSESNVTMKAGSDIIIGQGFSTAPGAVYLAEIEPNNCQTPGVPVFFKANPNHPSDPSITKINTNGMQLFAYPNPTTDLITVGALNNNYQNVTFAVTDLAGSLMAEYLTPTISNTEIRQVINADSYAPGLYIITMIADKQRYALKFAKK